MGGILGVERLGNEASIPKRNYNGMILYVIGWTIIMLSNVLSTEQVRFQPRG